MENKKTISYVVIGILLVIILILGVYIICYKVLSDQNKLIDNNSTTENDNQTTNKDDYDKEWQKCDESICAYKYVYKIKVINKNGALVYDSTQRSTQNIIETIETGKELEVFGDFVDTTELNTSAYGYDHLKFDEIKNYHYFAIDLCCERKYVKYSDVEIIESSIVTSEKFDETKKIYVHHDTYLYSGPGLNFQENNNNNNNKINKGTILEVNIYNRIDAANWFYVNYNGNKGWILEDYFTSVDYPYNEVAWGSAVLLDETKGEIYLEKEENLYKYAFSNDNIISKIPKGTKISYDYVTGETGVDYYHINYNGNSGWIEIDW